MTDEIKQGKSRGSFSTMYHELWDLYHPLIGDTATLFYQYLYRFRNNENGRSWKGRTSIVEKFRISRKTLPKLDKVLEASGLITIEYKPSGRGKDRIVYVINDPLERKEFQLQQEAIMYRLKQVVQQDKSIAKMLGKESEHYFLV